MNITEQQLKNKYEIKVSVKLKGTEQKLKGIIETDLVEKCDINVCDFVGRMAKNLINIFEKNG